MFEFNRPGSDRYGRCLRHRRRHRTGVCAGWRGCGDGLVSGRPARHRAGPRGGAVRRQARARVPVDVRETSQVDELVRQTIGELGRVDIAVANAGIARAVPLEQLDDDAWYETVDVDLTGVWRLFRAVLPHMRSANYGRLIATASISGIVSAWPQHPPYAAAKAGIVGLVHNLAVEYGPDGITANAVAPGVIKTPQSLDPVNSLGPEGVAATAPKSRYAGSGPLRTSPTCTPFWPAGNRST